MGLIKLLCIKQVSNKDISYNTGNYSHYFLITFFLKLLIYLFLAVLGPRFCARAFSSCGEQGPLFIAVRGPLTVTASFVVEHRLQTRRLSSCGSPALLLRGMWDLPRPGLEPVSPALAGRLSTTAPPGKPSNFNGVQSVKILNHYAVHLKVIYYYKLTIFLKKN